MHGGMFSSLWSEWNFKEVPWTVGKDFVAPTCATCHVSQVVTDDGTVVAKRTHQMSDRLPWRTPGLVLRSPPPEISGHVDNKKQGRPALADQSGRAAGQRLSDQSRGADPEARDNSESLPVVSHCGMGGRTLGAFREHHKD